MKNGQLYHFLNVRKSQERQASKKFYNKCSENSRSQIVFRTDIFRKLTLGAPDKRLRLGYKHTLLSRDLAQSAVCFYDSTKNGLMDARGFYLVLRVKKWGMVRGGGAGVNRWHLD